MHKHIDVKNNKIGSFLIFPTQSIDHCTFLDTVGEIYYPNSQDITTDTLELFKSDDDSIAQFRLIKENNANGWLFGKNRADYTFFVDESDEGMNLKSILLCKCKLDIVFVCVLITYPSMELLDKLCHPGYTSKRSLIKFGDSSDVDFELCLKNLFSKLKLKLFYDKMSTLLSAFIYNFTLFPERFETLKEMQQLTFDMHMMVPLIMGAKDKSEEDIAYVYSVKDQYYRGYRWGCCISSQTISYVVGDPDKNFEMEVDLHTQEGLPIVILCLYKKYAGIYFKRLVNHGNIKPGQIKDIKRQLIQYKLSGLVFPDTISYWYNIQTIYKKLIYFFGVCEITESISSQIELLDIEQEKIWTRRKEIVAVFIGFFGLISVFESLLAIIEKFVS